MPSPAEIALKTASKPATHRASAAQALPPASRTVAKRAPALDLTGRRIHFMGANGIGISALMELCAARGAIVSGCDCSDGAQVARLKALGLRIDSGHSAGHVADCDELVYSAAIPHAHAEVAAAETAGKKVSPRMHMLGKLARGMRSVCVTGAHGKTTTTSLIAQILITAGRDPSVFVGGVCKSLNGNVRVGRGEELVVETDESDNRLYEVVPSIAVLTNIDNDHLEHYGSMARIEEAARRFLASVDRADSLAALIGCGDDPRVQAALSNAKARCRRPVISYGFQPACAVRALNHREEGMDCRFDVRGPFGEWQDFYLPMPGLHNVLNALAAICVAWRLSIDAGTIREALSVAERVDRRFEIKGVVRGIRVVDDYGHHPTEIALTLKAAKSCTSGRIGVLFQPHRYTRTSALLAEFASCFKDANTVFLLPVYAAGEAEIVGANHHSLAKAMLKAGQPDVRAFESRAEAVAAMIQWALCGDTLMAQGAGDVTRAANELVSGL